ncbi:MAG TPA: hypothetical protein VM734_16070 [Kofleriaceae bacterium]|nr:hypothetical protein [Kofleriaceae bacterium]
MPISIDILHIIGGIIMPAFMPGIMPGIMPIMGMGIGIGIIPPIIGIGIGIMPPIMGMGIMPPMGMGMGMGMGIEPPIMFMPPIMGMGIMPPIMFGIIIPGVMPFIGIEGIWFIMGIALIIVGSCGTSYAAGSGGQDRQPSWTGVSVLSSVAADVRYGGQLAVA